ncbi:MAG: hypothetical protein D3920_12940, partial [Candidatus Electrothrix sp. AW2]|nr:hypothetical protein [Candidatus Electrothrix gigas]
TVIRWQPAQKSDQIFLLKDTTLFAHCKYFFAIDQKVMVAKVEVVLNLNEHHMRLLKLLGRRYEKLYSGNG